jgi:hypothetical protein
VTARDSQNRASSPYSCSATVQDFTLTLTPSPLNVTAGASSNPPATVTITPLNAFNSQVSLTPTSVPTGLTLTFSPATVGPGSWSTSAYVTAASNLSGSYTIGYSAIGGGITHTGNVNVTVQSQSPVIFHTRDQQGCSGGPAPLYAYNDGSSHTFSGQCLGFSCRTLTGCSVSPSSNVTATTGTVTDSCFDQSISANTNAAPGTRTFSCSFGNNGTYSTSLGIYDVTPRIDSMNPNPIPYPGTTPVTFTGVGFGNAPPTLQFTPGGVTVTIEPGNSPTQFTADITPPGPGDYQVQVISGGEGGNGFQSGGQTPSQAQSDPAALHVVGKPRILKTDGSTSAAFWYLGGVPGTTCDTGLACVDGYYLQTRLLVAAPPNDTNPNPTIKWSTNSTKLSLSDDPSASPTGSAEILTSQASSDTVQSTLLPPSQWSIHVTVTYDGIASDPFPVYINTPFSVTTNNMGQYCDASGACDCQATGFFPPPPPPPPPPPSNSLYVGYVTLSQDRVFDILQNQLDVPIRLHETLENPQLLGGWQGTANPIPIAGTWGPNGRNGWNGDNRTFNDYFSVCSNDTSNLSPPPTFSGQGTSTPVFNVTQKFWIGSVVTLTNPFNGACVQRALLTLFDDHGTSTNEQVPGIPATICSPGNVVN